MLNLIPIFLTNKIKNMSYISVDVDMDDILSSMSRYDRRNLLIKMQDDGFIPQECTIDSNGVVCLPEKMAKKIIEENNDDFNIALKKLYNNGWKLTKEDENFIINLSKKFF